MNDNRSVQRCLSLLGAFGHRPRQTLAELSKAVELPHSTVLRFLNTLERDGYVRKEAALWSLGPQMLELGFAALDSMGVNESVQAALQRLADAVQGSVNLGEKNKEVATIIARATSVAERRKLLIVNLRAGSSLPKESSLYKALGQQPDEWSLAHYPDRKQVSIAIPVFINSARLLSLGMSVDVDEYPMARVEGEVLELLRKERQYIERLMALEP
jgi:IclR family pca regulon transcriptional regulator